MSSVDAVESHGATGQDAVLSSRRGAFKALAHHVGRAGEEPVRVRIVRRPQDLLRADKVREYSEAGFDRLERNPAIALEEFARPRLQAGIVEKLIIEMAVSDVDTVLAGIFAVPLHLTIEVGDRKGLGQLHAAVALYAPDDVVGRGGYSLHN